MAGRHVLVCGKLRSPEEALAGIAVYLAWRANAQVERIVWSGWAEDWRGQRAFFDHIAGQGVELVFSETPRLALRQNIFHQMKTLHHGLAQFDADDVVFKSRTDRAPVSPEVMAKIGPRFDRQRPPAVGQPFKKRVMILGASLFQPYFFNDMLFMGRAGDLRRLVSFDLWYEGEHALLNAEQCFHSAPFMPERPFLRAFYKSNPGLIHESPEKSEQVYSVILQSELYLRSVHASLLALRDAYVVGMVDGEEEPRQEEFGELTLRNLLDPDVVERVRGLDYGRGGNALGFKHEACAPLLLHTPISPAEPRSLLELFGEDGRAAAMEERTLHEQSQDLARRLWDAFQWSIADAPRPEQFEGAALFVSSRDSYVR